MKVCLRVRRVSAKVCNLKKVYIYINVCTYLWLQIYCLFYCFVADVDERLRIHTITSVLHILPANYNPAAGLAGLVGTQLLIAINDPCRNHYIYQQLKPIDTNETNACGGWAQELHISLANMRLVFLSAIYAEAAAQHPITILWKQH